VLDGIAGLRRAGPALSCLGRPAAATSFNNPICAERAVAFAELSLEAAKVVGRRQGATVNDIGLTTAALALGRYLRGGGESHPWLRAFVPVSTRGSGDAADLGNRISMMFVELPVGERDPRAALEEVRRQTHAQKRAGHAVGLDSLLRAAGALPLPLRDAVMWLMTRPQTFNVVVSNVPGPPEPLYVLGRRLAAAYPAVPLAQGHAISVGFVSYCGTLHVGLYADPTIVPDLVEVAHDFSRSFDALRFALEPRRPGPTAPRPRPLLPERVLV
jgi:WS/DGAT/MGAT family acyltransferase